MGFTKQIQDFSHLNSNGVGPMTDEMRQLRHNMSREQ